MSILRSLIKYTLRIGFRGWREKLLPMEIILKYPMYNYIKISLENFILVVDHP